MPTLYKTANIDLSRFKSIPVNLVLATNCPNCSYPTVEYDFTEKPLEYPEKDQCLKLECGCVACGYVYAIPAKIMNIRMVIAYDLEKIRQENS